MRVKPIFMSSFTTTATLTEKEKLLLRSIFKHDPSKVKTMDVTRRSDKEFDLEIQGKYKSGGTYLSWLPLSTLHTLVNWPAPQYANESDYPYMVEQGDWSGIRDSHKDKVWIMLGIALKELKVTT